MQFIESLKSLPAASIHVTRDAMQLSGDAARGCVNEVCSALESFDFSRLTIQNPGDQTRITYVNNANQMSVLVFNKPN